jgi:CheY-like chemotaxis protein
LEDVAMQIVCPACNKRLQIADDKLPAERQVRLTCPACQKRFSFDPHSRKTATHFPATQTPSAASGPSIDIVDVGPAPRALVCLDSASHREACQNMLPSLGYNTVHVPSQQAQALAYLSQVPYACFILDARFDNSTLEANPTFACLLELPMERRRYMFVALCMPDVMTADAMTAYRHSVNLVINYADIPSCRHILEQHLAEHKRLYRVYRELRQQLGKDV